MAFCPDNVLIIDGVLEHVKPVGEAVPVVFDSPHSGKRYPHDFAHALPRALLRRAEDAYVDELFGCAPRHGATLLHALFPRSYIDPNRRADDIDESMLASPWPGGARPSPKVKYGLGLIRKWEFAGPVYDRPLRVSEVRHRIENYYRPYHRKLQMILHHIHSRFGNVWHINCHSMRSRGPAKSPDRPGKPRPDICIGDRDGVTCESGFTELVAETLRAMGYQVTVNNPYKGVELVRRYSDPAQNRHSLQIEVNRRLYLDEKNITLTRDAPMLKKDLAALVQVVCAYARSRCQK